MKVGAAIAIVLLAACGGRTATSGCHKLKDEIGECCRMFTEHGASRRIELDPASEPIARFSVLFDCSSPFCVDFPGRGAYCTTECQDASACPSGFSCTEIAISPDERVPKKKLCLSESHDCERCR
jgi:hypothetical protein